jgi:DNA modification methylase
MTGQSLVPIRRNSPPLHIEEAAISGLRRNASNPRRHSEKQIIMLARSIDAFGFVLPSLIDEENRILAGNAQVLAAERLGMTTIPVIIVKHLSKIEKRGLVIALNRLAELGNWDRDILRSELQFFKELDIDFDFSVLGVETPEIDIILDTATEDVADDALPRISHEAPAVSRPGELWCAGPHRILCGDALSVGSYEALLGDERARLIVTDPPHNVRIAGHAGGRGAVRHREFAMASGEMSPEEFKDFLGTAMQNMASFSIDGSLHYSFMDWRHAGAILTAGQTAYSELKNICVWRKPNSGMGSLYRSQHELVYVFKNGTAAHINNINLGVHGRNRTDIWDYDGLNSFGKDRDELLAMHPTVKPVALIADVIKDASERGDLVLDPFGGSGTTLIAAEKTQRRAAVMEIDPLYVDAIVRRWQTFTEKAAICAESGVTFAQRERAAGNFSGRGSTQDTEAGDGR